MVEVQIDECFLMQLISQLQSFYFNNSLRSLYKENEENNNSN